MTLLFLSGLFLAGFKMFSKKIDKFNLNTGDIRGCDAHGCGSYGAGRGGRQHAGVDLIVAEDTPITAPFPCKVVRYGYPYANDLNFRLVEIQGLDDFSKFKAKIMYVKVGVPIGTVLLEGQFIANADNIAKKYPGITNHVHFELFENGKQVDPTQYFI